MNFDVIVIGAGHNGLVCAIQLAKGGRKVLVLEGQNEPGGLCRQYEFHPGFSVPGVLHDTEIARADVLDGLGLQKHGLSFARESYSYYAPAKEGPGLLLHRDASKAREELKAHSKTDPEGYAKWRSFLDRVRSFMSGILNQAPSSMSATSTSALWDLGKRGLALRRLGKKDMLELMRIAPMCVADWLNENMESQLLKELLAAPAVQNTFMGPWSAGSAANLLFHESTLHKPIMGGPAALIAALSSATKEHSVEIRTQARVKQIRIEGGRAVGVTLESGEALGAGAIAATCDPKRTFLDLMHPKDVPLRLEDQFRNFRTRGTAAKVHLAISGNLEFKGRPGETFEAIRVGGGHIDELERAFDAVKYGRFSKRPHLDIRVPSLFTKGLAPE